VEGLCRVVTLGRDSATFSGPGATRPAPQAMDSKAHRSVTFATHKSINGRLRICHPDCAATTFSQTPRWTKVSVESGIPLSAAGDWPDKAMKCITRTDTTRHGQRWHVDRKWSAAGRVSSRSKKSPVHEPNPGLQVELLVSETNADRTGITVTGMSVRRSH